MRGDSPDVIPRDGATGARASRPMHPWLALWFALAAAVLLGCQSPPAPPAFGETAPPALDDTNVEARLFGANGSVVNGSAVLHEVRGGVDLALWLGSVGPGRYRVAIHATGNCSSRNAFSAGAPWAPPGIPVAVILFDKNDDTRTITMKLPGYKLRGPDGVFGRAVVVHEGSSASLEAEPGVPNARIACGVIGVPERLFPALGL